MLIVDIYHNYQIMPNLQLHQLRVAAVARKLAESVWGNVDVAAITTACLLHDMGNIIKFDLNNKTFADFLEPEGQEYWLGVQADFLAHYGNDEHLASLKIAREVGVLPYVMELIDAIGFDRLDQNYKTKNISKMICEYADNRVTPFGIVDLETRLQDLENRYAQKFSAEADAQKRRHAQEMARKSEAYIFSQVSLKPSDLTDSSLDDTITELKSFKV